MFPKFAKFLSDLKTRWSDWRAGRINTVEKAKADPERFVRQLIADTQKGKWWGKDSEDRFTYFASSGDNIFHRLSAYGKVFNLDTAYMHYELRLLDPVTERSIAVNRLSWQCSATSDYRGEQTDGNLKIRELYRLVAYQHVK